MASLRFLTRIVLKSNIQCLLLSHVQLCDAMDCNPPGSSVLEDSPGKNTGVGCHFLLWKSNIIMCHLISVHKYLPVYSIYSTSGMSKGCLFLKKILEYGWFIVLYTVTLLYIYINQLKIYIYPLFLDSLSIYAITEYWLEFSKGCLDPFFILKPFSSPKVSNSTPIKVSQRLDSFNENMLCVFHRLGNKSVLMELKV